MATFLVIIECEVDDPDYHSTGIAADSLRERGMFATRDGVSPVRVHLAIKETATQILDALKPVEF